jgi:hypothetical protein
MCTAPAHARDVEVDVRPGIGSSGSKSPVFFHNPTPNPTPYADSIVDQTQSPYRIGFDADVSAGIRLLPYLSVGIAGQIRTMSGVAPNDMSGITKPSRFAWGAGPYANGYLHLTSTRVVPWAGVGVAYLQDTQSYNQESNNPPAQASVTTTHYGIAFPVSVGIEYPFSPLLRIGPSFTYARIIPITGCSTHTGPGFVPVHCDITSAGSGSFIEAQSYDAWTAGLDVRFVF